MRKKKKEREWSEKILTWKEIGTFFLALIFISFIFSIKMEGSVVIFDEIQFPYLLVFLFLLFFVFVVSQKITAEIIGLRTRLKLLSFRRFWFRPSKKFSFAFPLWLVLPILLLFFNVKWPAILDFDLEKKRTRLKREFVEIEERDVSKIAFFPILALLFLAIILSFFDKQLTLITTLFAFLSSLPFGNGAKIFFGARTMWLFTFTASLLSFLGYYAFARPFSLIIGIVLALALTLLYFFYFESKYL